MDFIKKKLVNKFLFFLLFLSSTKLSATETFIPTYVSYTHKIRSAFAQKMQASFNLVCSGSGGSMPHDIEEISIDFIAYKKASIEEARKLEVLVTEEFIKMINSDEKIRPYLREYPLTPKRAHVSISFHKPNNSPYADNSVAYIFQVKDTIFYYADDAQSDTFISLRKEPYEEALKIVQGSK